MTTYSKREADDILRIADFGGSLGPIRSESTLHGGNLIVVNERGVWPDTNIIGLQAGEHDLGWKPCWELLGTADAPDPRDTPGLPFPFTASQLAAWMLHGLGWFAREAMGEWHDGPNSRLFLHPEESKTREVVRAAYAAYRDAENVVGENPEEQVRRAKMDLECLELADASVEKISEARAACKAAQARAEELSPGWRGPMVRELLKPRCAAELPVPTPRTAMQRQRAHEEEMLAVLRELSYDPLSLPPPLPGKASKAKSDVRNALLAMGRSKDVIKETWQRLLDAEKANPGSGIAYASRQTLGQ